MKRLIILIILSLVTILVFGQTDSTTYPVPGQMQCRVLAITSQKRNKADLTCLNMRGDTVYLKYGWRGIGTRINLKVGTWLTVRYKECRPGEWIEADIKINH
jgi:hypothetical protein